MQWVHFILQHTLSCRQLSLAALERALYFERLFFDSNGDLGVFAIGNGLAVFVVLADFDDVPERVVLSGDFFLIASFDTILLLSWLFGSINRGISLAVSLVRWYLGGRWLFMA